MINLDNTENGTTTVAIDQTKTENHIVIAENINENSHGPWSHNQNETSIDIKNNESNGVTNLQIPQSPQQKILDEQVDGSKSTMEVNNDNGLNSTETTTKVGEKVVQEGFCCVISMHDGVVLFTTPSITECLGFPRDMWLGRSFIDFVHPKDRSTFANQITSGIAVPFTETKGGYHKDLRNSVYVMLRRYRGLRTVGYGVTSKAVSYQPFRLSLSFREAPDEPRAANIDPLTPNSMSMLLVIYATPVKSIYKGTVINV